MDSLLKEGAEPIWASQLSQALKQIVALVDQAEQDIVETARSAQTRLEDIISGEVFSVATSSKTRRAAAQQLDAETADGPQQMAGE